LIDMKHIHVGLNSWRSDLGGWPATTGRMTKFRRLPVLALSFAGFLTQLDVTAVVVAMPSIGRDLGFGVAGMAWVMDAYSLAFTGLLLASGALADRHGRRRVLLAGNILFALASLACGLAWDGPSLWAARAVQGMAAAFVVTGSIALIASAYPAPKDRARAFALSGIVSGAAMAIGPTLGGVLADWIGWRWIFLANIPCCIAAGWIVPRLIAEERADDRRALDPLGILLLTAALAVAIEGLLSAGHPSAHVLPGLAASGALLAMFVLQQRRQARPLLDPALLARPATIGVATLLFTVSIGYWAVLVYLPLFLGKTFSFSAGQSGIVLLATTIPMIVLPPIAGSLVTRWGWRKLFAMGLGAMALGDVVLAATPLVVDTMSQFAMAIAGMIVIGMGAALVQAQLSGAVVALAPAAQAGMASALTIVMRQGGFAIGIAILGATLGSAIAPDGFPRLFAVAAVASGVGLLAALVLLPKSGIPAR
jgi:EmrB/QacA subfamily drug resistance transporter